MLCDVTKISRIPTMHQYILASYVYPQSSSSSDNLPHLDPSVLMTQPHVGQSEQTTHLGVDQSAQVSLWHITAGFMISQFSHVAATGIF